ncbi:VQ motif-containing protein 8, chloroplastic-like [Telopea speciosissima]|uniref:VQ motif-containing protein 8, chloroplastic-like n=1 Tax=Telopea speciosissima TaxID=54955 RepID=UPI001CC333E1|nr:VQ motif-containing protein 8, chloroplastic-like [Telopea speciosissima]
MSSSGESTKRVSPRREQIRGPRPRPLYVGVGTDSCKIKKPVADQRRPPGPVVIHLKSPEIIHTRPQDFMALVQNLTGKKVSSGSISAAADLVDDSSCKPCEISSQNDEIEIFSRSFDSIRDPQDNKVEVSTSLFAPKLPPSWSASPPSMSANFSLPASPMITYSEWHEFSPIL